MKGAGTMVMSQQKQLAYDMAMEYFRQNDMFKHQISDSDYMVEKFAEVENAFYTSLTKYSKEFDKCL